MNQGHTHGLGTQIPMVGCFINAKAQCPLFYIPLFLSSTKWGLTVIGVMWIFCASGFVNYIKPTFLSSFPSNFPLIPCSR